MPDKLSLSLQAFPTVDKEKDSLKYLISRINQQRGSFRNVSEQGLEEEIEAQKSGTTNADDPDEHDVDIVEEAEEVKTKQEELAQAREDMMRQIGQACNESAQALDFISLLLSRNAPAAAQTTLSQFLQQTVPLGSLGGEVVQAPQVSELEKRNQKMASIGWRMQSLNGAADSLLKSAARLEEEMARETTYWDQVLAVKEKGWSLSRLPREKHTLGVRYGFAEAYAEFRDRGLAAIRRDADGNISLDRGLRSSGDQILRVRILQQGKSIASSSKGSKGSLAEDDSITREILRARNSIFDEELHHELHREARRLLNQGVRCIGERVLLPYKDDEQIEIDLVPLEDEHEDLEAPEGDNTVADAIALSLRVLLSHAHQQNLHRRSQIPPPLRDTKPPRPIYALLKPVIEHLQHQSHVTSLQHFLNSLHSILSAAALPFSFTSPTSPYNFTAMPTDKPTLEALIQTLTAPLHSTITLNLPTPNTTPTTTATITIHTTLLPPHHSTTYTLTLNHHQPSSSPSPSPPSISTPTSLPPNPSPLTTFPTPTHHTSLSSLTSQLLHLTTLSLTHRTATTFEQNWHAPPTLYASTLSRKSRKNEHQMVPKAVSERAAITLTERKLGLEVKSWRGGGMGWEREREREWSWYADGDDGGVGEKRGFDEVFREEVDKN